MTIDADFYTKLDSLTTFAVQKNKADASKGNDRVLFERSDQDTPTFIGGFTSTTTETWYDVEVQSRSAVDAMNAAVTLKDALHNFTGTWGSRRIQKSKVFEVADDYIPLTDQDANFHTVAFRVQVFHK